MKTKFNVIMPGEVYDHMCHEQPVFSKYKKKIINFRENLNNSNTLKKVQLCLPLYRGLKKKNLDYIIKSINKTIETIEK
jgi:dTDP-4-amino-4,6-dideoxygalactose transaminase